MPRDWYPQDPLEVVAFHVNFALQLPTLAAKYNISQETLDQVAADAAWVAYWLPVPIQLKNIRKSLTEYIRAVGGNTKAARQPNPIGSLLQGPPPHEVPPGVEFRTRKLARMIRGSMVYSPADGALLGIIMPSAAARDLVEIEPKFTVLSIGSFKLQFKFNRRRMDGMRFQFRRKGGAWEFAGVLLTSRGILAFQPAIAGTAEQIELRGSYMLKNDVVGKSSHIVTAVIAP